MMKYARQITSIAFFKAPMVTECTRLIKRPNAVTHPIQDAKHDRSHVVGLLARFFPSMKEPSLWNSCGARDYGGWWPQHTRPLGSHRAGIEAAGGKPRPDKLALCSHLIVRR